METLWKESGLVVLGRRRGAILKSSVLAIEQRSVGTLHGRAQWPFATGPER